MDLHWFDQLYLHAHLIIILCVSVGLIYLFYNIYYKKSSSGTTKLKLPPGRKGFPLFGETLDFILSLRSANPERFITERMKKHSADVFQTSLLGEDIAVFCGPSGNKFLYSPSNKNVTSWWPRTIAKIFFQPDVNQSFGEKMVKTLGHLMQFMKPESLQRYIPVMDSMAKDHIHKEWSPYKEVRVSPLSKKYTIALACRLFLSIEDPKTVAEFTQPYDLAIAGVISVPINLPGTTFNRALKASKILTEKIKIFIRKRKMELEENKNSGKMDLMTSMILDGMTEIEIIDKIQGFFVASYDTTSSLITLVISYLAAYPHVYHKVFEEQMKILKSKGERELLNWEDVQKMKYTWCVACEVMRLVPVALGGFREATSEFTYAGYTIPKGWKLTALYSIFEQLIWTPHSTHKNSEYFPKPEKFDPSRFEGNIPAPYTFVPFGGGTLMCPGKQYARFETLVYIHNVVTKFKWEKVIPNEKFKYILGPVFEKGLPISLVHL
ncbi:hypothetical protein EZV62_004452 [Acer yangbiense]|uniref:Cytochrome P450 n=1 Tax=Acer yangbiense TaxID=1000413 RepID=A0A5C7IJF1_9ROSI|nr:hypothetical protein EZV62_004452 [Acer yangbiense]